jgi:hypothetical protein
VYSGDFGHPQKLQEQKELYERNQSGKSGTAVHLRVAVNTLLTLSRGAPWRPKRDGNPGNVIVAGFTARRDRIVTDMSRPIGEKTKWHSIAESTVVVRPTKSEP